METPPLSPVRSAETSPYTGRRRRRTSSSNFSACSRRNRYSDVSSQAEGVRHLSGGNLADELDQLSSCSSGGGGEAEGEAEGVAESEGKSEDEDHEPENRQESRDSSSSSSSFSSSVFPPGDFSPSFEESLHTLTLLAAASPDPCISQTTSLLHDLPPSGSLETALSRLTTSTNSLSTHLLSQSKALQGTCARILGPFATLSLSQDAARELSELVEGLVASLPLPDPGPLRAVKKFEVESGRLLELLGQVTDSLQMGRQAANAAQRQLRVTRKMVEDLRRETDEVERAWEGLRESGMEERLRLRCGERECRTLLEGLGVEGVVG
ncbi:hypothetical protein K470DRAFT_292891 [Piedraia hortae CBS 480.64]|uniref:Uncharacterized protein n=1 Tax=Piedraia hortae CBS 480.64 TaxID=1314780 RepID=A0A6A7C7G3_9PEZI|nr:hypothetical protein K470DRAFT_292891 [Piedraia hortae CBS 480.64]